MKFFDLIDLESRIQILDVGAAAINETPMYKRLLDIGAGHLNAFEGDERQVEAIRRSYGSNVDVFGGFLFDGTVQTVHLASSESGMSSLLKPDGRSLGFFNGFDAFGRIHSTEEVQTSRLDDIAGLPDIDLAKMDVQGAELTILKNGAAKLRNCLAVQLEVSFVCLYENQPAFGEVDTWMRRQGFIPHCFLEVKRWSIKPTVFGGNFRIPGNQLLEADVVYVRNPLDFSSLDVEQVKKIAVIANYCFKSYDLCAHALIELEKRGVIEPYDHNRYLAKLSVFG